MVNERLANLSEEQRSEIRERLRRLEADLVALAAQLDKHFREEVDAEARGRLLTDSGRT